MATMRFASVVNLPHEVLDAQQDGRLVIFAGAGVSMPPPSSLPSFKGLALEIAAGSTALEENEPLDRFLGRVHMAGGEVQKKAKGILSKPSSKPNILHENLVGIFSEPSALRIVTTNFDPHFESTLRKRWPDSHINTYQAPALPEGSDFTGLVYLHGSVQGPGRLVLTDQDFGQAYLTHGWARRFLQELFETYTVLFVGYSHQDVVMNYLARGLPPRPKYTRYALVDSSHDKRQWEYRGIGPIIYEWDESHSRLQVFSDAWARYSQKGVLQREVEIQQIVKGDPKVLQKEDEDHLLYILSKPSWAQYFFRHADSLGWLDWANANGVLDGLFGSAQREDNVWDLCDWFCRDLLGARGSAALKIVALRKRPIHSTLWRLLSDKLWRAAMSSTKDGARTEEQSHLLASWVIILMQQEPVNIWEWDYVRYLLKELILPQERETALELLRVLTIPLLKPSEGFFPERPVNYDIYIRADDYCLREFLGTIKDHLDSLSVPLFWIAVLHLDLAYQKLRLLERAGDDYDPLSWRRSRVTQTEFHPHEPILHLVDIAKIAIDWLAQNSPQLLVHMLFSLMDDKSPLVKRICIYGIDLLPDLTPDEKIHLLLTHRWLESRLKPETFDLLAHCYPQLSEERRRELLTTAEEYYRREDEQYRKENPDAPAYDKYSMLQLLAWLEKSDAICMLVQERLAAIREAHPAFSVSEHPDLAHRSIGPTGIEAVSPFSADEIQSWTAEMFLDRLAELLAEQPQSRRMFDPHIHGYLDQVADLVGQDPDRGFAIASELVKRGDAKSQFWTYLFRGWTKATDRDVVWRQVIRLISEHPQVIGERIAYNVAQFLMERVRDRKAPISTELIHDGVEVARLIAERVHDDTPKDFDGNWYQLAMSRSRGILALFSLHALEILWFDEGKNPDWRISDSFRSLFENLVKASPFGRAILGGSPQLLLACDQTWTQANLIPLFSFKVGTDGALQVWSGFLGAGRITPPVRAALLPYLGELFDNFDLLTKHLRRYLPVEAAWFAFLDEGDPLIWLRKFLNASADDERAAFADQIGGILRSMKPEQRDELWENWLERYFSSRIGGPPRIENKEKVSLLEWCHVFPERFGDLTDLLVTTDPPQAEFHRLHELMSSQEALSTPDAFGRLLLWILKGQIKDRFSGYCHELRVALENLRGKIDNGLYHKLVERYSELGCVDAPTLLG